MFLFFGIMPVQKMLNYNLGGICPRCGKAANYEIMMQASSFSLFFIPLFSFGKKYFVKTGCCGELYAIPKALGQKIERNEPVTVTESDLTPLRGYVPYHSCPQCGAEVQVDFNHCPKCGKKL